jgi:ribonuclease Z
MVTPSEQQQFLHQKDSPAIVVQKDTIAHGHSTPVLAAKFAQDVREKKLILTHFSSRYTGDAGEVSMNVMWQIEDQARKACHLKGDNDVVAAWDHMSINVPLR